MYDLAAAPRLSHADEPLPAFVADDYAAYEHQDDPASHGGGVSRKLSWMFGAALISVGLLGISADRILWMFDSAAIGVGLLALPPVTELVRRHVRFFPPSGVAHGALALLVLGGAFALNVSGLLERRATFPTLEHVRDVGFGEVNLTDPAALEQRTLAAKIEYMAKVQSALEAMARESKLTAELDAAPTLYDEAVLNERAALASLRSSMTLSAEEEALVLKLAARLSAARSAMAPGLRRAYVEELNGPLSSYGVSARMIGRDMIEFVGAALADPRRQTAILELTERDRVRLGFSGVRFVAADGLTDAGGPSLSEVSEPADAPMRAPAAAIGPAAALAPAAGAATQIPPV